MTCIVCHRQLMDPESIRRGIGPVCSARRESAGPTLFDDKKGHRVRGVFSGDIVLSRDPDRVPVVNIEQTLERHSPTGFEWGYGGSGPADLALNILIRFTTTERAHALHQSFKADFLMLMPDAGGTITGKKIMEWLGKAVS